MATASFFIWAWASWRSANEPLAEMAGVSPAVLAAGVLLSEVVLLALANLASRRFCLEAEGAILRESVKNKEGEEVECTRVAVFEDRF